MFDIFLEKIKQFFSSRILPIALIYVVLLFVVINRLFVLQIVETTDQKEKFEYKSNKSRDLKSTRGSIYDKKGNLLAYNDLSYSVIMEDSTLIESNMQRNHIIHNLIKILEQNGDELDHEFHIKLNKKNEFEFTVDGDELIRFKKKAYEYTFDKNSKELSQEQLDATAEEVFNFLRFGTSKIPMFNISEEYSAEDALKIMKIRFLIFQNYPKYLTITLASNVSKETVAAVSERRGELLGIQIQHETHRVYNDSKYFAHMLGYTGQINSSELEQLEAEGIEGYNSTDVVGKSGIEKEFDSYLRGEKGSELIAVNTAGKVVEVIDRKDPTAGNDIHLTIDRDLQIAAYDLLEKKITSILISKIQPDMNYGTKGENSKGILIPIYEVYYALINNNVIDINKFESKSATKLEKQVYEKFKTHQRVISNEYDKYLSFTSETLNKNADRMEDYLDYFYSVLIQDDIIMKDKIDKNDSEYSAYLAGRISLSKFIRHSISNNYVNLAKLELGDEYYSTEEIYDRLINFVKDILKEDNIFNKKLYKDLVFSYKVSGSEICLLLFDQGVLEYNQENIDSLRNGNISPYSFIIKQLSKRKITPGMLALEPCSGSLVVTDVKNGNILALVTYPSYDNNMLANKINANYYNNLLSNKAGILNNRATTEIIAPGSTYKMISAITTLEENAIYPEEKITDLGVFDKVLPEVKCHRFPSTHGSVNIVNALKVSCNYFFNEGAYRLSTDSNDKYIESMGLSKLEKYASLFGFSEKSGIEIYEVAPKISDKDPIRSAIGQGSNAFAPIHLSKYITGIANRGTVYNLSLVNKIMDKDGNVVLSKEPQIYKKLDAFKASTWNSVQEGMYAVVNEANGSVYNIYKNFPIKIAGKTGTAEISKSKPNHALFVSYAPYDNPEISVVAVIPNGYTSGNAAELGKDIYKYYYNVEGIANDMEVKPNEETVVYD